MNPGRLIFACILSVGGLGCSNGGAGSDAGSDANMIDTGSDVMAADGGDASSDASDVCGSYRYCENFESYTPAVITNNGTLGPWKATVTGTGIVMQIDTAMPYRGTKSLHITAPTNAGEDAGTSVSGILNQKATAGLIPGNNVYGRAMVYYSNTGGNDLPLGVHSWLFNSGGNSTIADGGVTMNMGGGGAKLQLNYHPPLPLVEQSVQGGNITAGAWHCVQWQYDGSGTPPNDVGNVWVDGTLAVTSPQSKGWNYATPWDTFDFGFTHYQALANGVDVYLDEFALDGAMVPCPQ